MGTKNNPGHFDCHDKAHPDEPIFTLLGRDMDAPAAVRRWASKRSARIANGDCPQSDLAKVAEACALADDMERYQCELAAGTAAQGQLTVGSTHGAQVGH